MEKTNLCPFCGQKVNVGDQICVHCGRELINTNLTFSEMLGDTKNDKKEKNFFFWIAIIFACLLFIFFISFLVWYFFIRGRV